MSDPSGWRREGRRWLYLVDGAAKVEASVIRSPLIKSLPFGGSWLWAVSVTMGQHHYRECGKAETDRLARDEVERVSTRLTWRAMAESHMEAAGNLRQTAVEADDDQR